MSNTAAPMQGTAPISTTLDVGASSIAVGAGAPAPEVKQPEPKPESPGDTMRAEMARIREEEAKDADKVKGQGEDAAKDAKAKLDDTEKAEADKGKPKDQPDADKAKDDTEAKAKTEPAEKAEKSEADKPAAGQEADKSRQSEGSKRVDPPARFLPKAKEAWVNVPHSVRDDVYRMETEHEAERAQTKQVVERYESVRQYDEIAQKNGRELKDSLAKVVQVEQALARNPIMGIELILREIGPRRPDGSTLSLYEVAQHIAKQSPEQYRASINGAFSQQQNQQREQAQSSEVQELRTTVQSMQAERAAEKIIEPFKAEHPRYQELQEDIAFFLKSGKIPASLSPVERLSAAYDMAERINPVGSRSASPALEDKTNAPAGAKAAAAVDDAGSKSVRGAPTGGSDPDDDDADATDLRKLLEREKRKLAS